MKVVAASRPYTHRVLLIAGWQAERLNIHDTAASKGAEVTQTFYSTLTYISTCIIAS